MSTELIPVNNTTEQNTQELFSNTMFGNVHTFINMYNSGILNKTFPETKELAELIRTTYKNVTVVGSKPISIQSQQEFMSRELSQKFNEWSILSRVIRETKEEVQAGTLTPEDTLFLTEKGELLKVDGNNATETDLNKLPKNAHKALLKLSTNDITLANLNEAEYQNEYNEYNNEYTNEYNNEYNTELTDEDTTEEKTPLKELTEEDTKRMIKVSDLTQKDDTFIIEIYETYNQYTT